MHHGPLIGHCAEAGLWRRQAKNGDLFLILIKLHNVSASYLEETLVSMTKGFFLQAPFAPARHVPGLFRAAFCGGRRFRRRRAKTQPPRAQGSQAS
jgi:hypothetical protein